MIPLLQKTTSLPPELKAGEIERAVQSFVEESDDIGAPVDKTGFYNQVLESIAGAVIFKQTGRDFWLATDNFGVAAFALAHPAKDVDNTLCYWMTCAWVAPRYRRNRNVKLWYRTLVEEARRQMCRHVLIPASRNVRAYCRWLNDGWHPYLVVLKKDL